MKASERIDLILEKVGETFSYEEEAELEANVVVASHLLYEEGDDETTEWTTKAKRRGRGIFAGEKARTAQFVEVDGELVVVEIVGQAPDQRRHRQGLRPERLRFLSRIERELGVRVLLAFYHGRWELAWLETLPDPENIVLPSDGDRDAARVGWYAGDDLDLGPNFWISEEFAWPPREPPPGGAGPGPERLVEGLA